MMIRIKWIGKLGVLVGAVCIGGCEDVQPTLVADETLVGIDADAVLFDMEDYLSSEGVRSGVVRADTAHVYNDSSEIRMWGVEMTLFHEDGSERAHVTSEQGTLDSVTEEMTARGNVVLVMNQGAQRVESPELHYDSNSVFTRDGRVTRGTCFRSDLSFTTYSVCNIRGSAGAIRGDGPGRDEP